MYRLADGGAYGAVLRWDIEGRRKEIRPIIWDGEAYLSQGFGDKRPLYNSDLIAQRPLAPVLIVEGEKSADGALRFVPEGWVVTTWQGGANATGMTDWSLLSGHRCVIWPDNDTPGVDAAEKVRYLLSSLGVESAVVPLPSSYPDGWDLGDAAPEGVSGAIITSRMVTALAQACVLSEELVPQEDEDDGPRSFIDSALEYKALGYDRQLYYVLSSATKQVEEYTASALMSERGCMEIIPDEEYWQEMYGNRGKVNWVKAGAHIMKQCQAMGVYDEDRLRARGVWSDDGRTVLNLGDEMIVNGHRVNPVQFKSRFIYERRQSLLLDGLGEEPADDSLGRQIRNLCNLARWESPVYGDLLAGWIATAVVCGGLPWRTHCWITGNQGSGKTTIVKQIAAACLGDVAIYPMGQTTEAGIRSHIGNDARPVVFDEGEGGDARAQMERRQSVIQLMRLASSETRGRIMKGSASHKGVSFTIRSSFMMSSIGVGLKEAADLSRTTVLTVKPLDAHNAETRRVQEAQWKAFNAACVKLPLDLPQRLLSRQFKNLITLRKNIEVYKEVIAVNMGNRRMGDQLGTLLAGCHSLFSDAEISTRAAESYLKMYNWTEFTEVRAEREDLALIHHIMGFTIRVDCGGNFLERTIGELIDVVFGRVSDTLVGMERAEQNLKRHGLRPSDDHNGLLIATSLQAMSKIMSSSDYAEGWWQVLMRHPEAQRIDKPIKFAGVTSRAVFLPAGAWS
jgi:putative DNA primase/helicase